MIDSLDRDAWDGEIGYALDWLHHTTGLGPMPACKLSPNDGQDFAKHLEFYTTLNEASV